MPKHNAADIDVDTFDYNRYVGLIYKNKMIVEMSSAEAWSLGRKLLLCACTVDRELPRDVKL